MAIRKYPWEVWFGAARTEITRGVDYQLSQFMMYQTIKNNAWKRGVKLRIHDTGTSLIIEVQGAKLDIPHTDKVAVPG